jgi:hypothetical protein
MLGLGMIGDGSCCAHYEGGSREAGETIHADGT